MKKTAIYQKKRPGAARWFNKWVQSPRWLLGFGVAVGVCLGVYALHAAFGRVRPGSVLGLAYGIAATALFAGVFFYSIKRRTMQIRALGRAWPYLQFHVYAGTLFLLLMGMHTGFQWPKGVLTWILWITSVWTVATGLLGIVLQKWIPTLLNSGLSTEVHYDRIPELVEGMRERAAALAATAHPMVQDFHRRHLAPVLAAPETRLIYFVDITGGAQARIDQFEYLHGLLPAADAPALDALQDLYRTKLEIDAHFTLQKALRWWLYLHVPVSVLLFALLALHIFTVLYY
ncbi:MAG: hypothetical protein R3247_16240 [Rhodothermales bacterium]|nr:hypothetical protein [Rhodothermales bacterium]